MSACLRRCLRRMRHAASTRVRSCRGSFDASSDGMKSNVLAIPLFLAFVGCDKPAPRAEPISCADAGRLLAQRKHATLEGVVSRTGGIQCVLDTWNKVSM